MAKHNNDVNKPEDAIELLRADHDKVRNLFAQYEAANDRQTKRELAEEAFVELEIHSQLEENVFYPALEEETDEEGKKLLAESLKEHQMVTNLIQELRKLDPDDQMFDAKFHELMENVEHHVEEEENDMFPKAEEQLEGEMEELVEEMQELKQQLLAS